MALINVAAIKTVIVDLSDAPPAWRIASFMGLGLLMIGAAVGYAKVTARMGLKEQEEAPPGESFG